MAYRDDLVALGARKEALATEVADKTRELDSARQLFDEAHARARLPVLPNLRVATPCTAEWAAMTGDDRMRACGACNKHVYNLSGMTRDEAEALIVDKAGKLCVRYFQRTDGTIILKDCEVAITQQRRRRVIAAGAIALLAGAGGLIRHELRATHAAEPVAVAPPTITMGGSAFTPPPDMPNEPPPNLTSPPEIHHTMGVVSIRPQPPEPPPHVTPHKHGRH